MHKITLVVGVLALALVVGFVIELLIIKYNGTPVAVPDIPRSAETFGSGPPLTYAVLGDSTSVGQGAPYDQGIARGSARHLANTHTVALHNFGISGARAADVRQSQLPKAVSVRPDVVLLSVTANDVTHMTSINSVRGDLMAVIDGLRSANPNVRIIFTGAPQMGSIPRFPEPIRSLARLRTAHMNTMARRLVQEQGITFAPIAEKTGPAFSRQPELFAADKFHPNEKGYALWTAVINEALGKALPT